MNTVILEDIQDADHLGEDEDLVAVLLEFGQQFVDQDKFSTGLDQGVEHMLRVTAVSLSHLL